MKKLIIASISTVMSSFSIAESFNTTLYDNHQVTVGVDDFDGSMVRTILILRDQKLDSSRPDQYISEFGYVCSPSISDAPGFHIRSYYTTSHYVYGTQVGGTLASTISYRPIQLKFDNSESIITVPLTQESSSLIGPELDLLQPGLIEKMKISSVMRVRDGIGGSSKFDMSGVGSAFTVFFKYCR